MGEVMPEGITLNFKSSTPSCILTFEDNGKVAYAYLKMEGKIVGEVWLYNRSNTPDNPEWTDRNKAPFANSNEYVANGGVLVKPVGPTDVLVDWEYDAQGPVAYVYIFEDLFGVVGINDKPGYARYAKKDGPLAKVMQIE
jgi:hypothetical protein